MTVSGSGIAPPARAKTRNGSHLGDGVGEDVADELADVVVDPPAGFDRRGNGGEVVVGEDHRGGLAGDIGPRTPHRHADVRAAQRGRVVDSVAGHGDDLAGRAQGVGDAQLGFGGASREDHLPAGAEQVVELVFGHRVQLGAA